MADSGATLDERRATPASPQVIIAALAIVGSLIFFVTAYALLHAFEGLPTGVSVGFAFAVLAAIALSVLVAGSLLDVYRNTRAGLRGARLHQRLVLLLSAVAVIPAIVAFTLAAAVLKTFADEYFVERVSDANLVAKDFANGYMTAEARKLGPELVQLAADLALQAQNGLTPESAPIGFRRYLLGQMILRDLSAVTLLDANGQIVAEVSRVQGGYRLPPRRDFEEVSRPGATPYRFSAHDISRFDAWYAVLKLGAPSGAYLIAYKPENPALSEQLLRVRTFRDETAEVRGRLLELTRIFAVGFALVMILLLLGAVWLGLVVANAIVGPVRRLATAAVAVAEGDLASRVDVRRGDGELGDLGRAFNDMTHQLEAQRDDLVAAHEQSDLRRRFIETVVTGVPAGVLNVSLDGRVALANPSAERVLGRPAGRVLGLAIDEVAPELRELMDAARRGNEGEVRSQIELTRAGTSRIINVRISPDDPELRTGYLVTLDDITELVQAQRNAAWGEVARRIAHEIKNPLTPIQLSAERLKRKFGERLGEDREVFDLCTDTIIRHVGDIGRMVNEFSSFARMPEPIMTEEELKDVVRGAVFSFSVANPNISFRFELPEHPVRVICDGRLIGQAVVNLVKNAVESISESPALGAAIIIARVEEDEDSVRIEVADTGRGLPTEGRSRLTEPYVTTRAKGTGLGLAIVRKAIEEHGGSFTLLDTPAAGERGATARIILPRKPVRANDARRDRTVPAR